MDIKGFVRNISPFGPSGKVNAAQARPETEAKTNADNDRDGNGQASTGDEKKRKSLTPEELQQVVAQIENLAGVKENGLTVRLVSNEETVVVYVEDRDGKVVRRIPEADLSLFATTPQKKSGNLLNKAL